MSNTLYTKHYTTVGTPREGDYQILLKLEAWSVSYLETDDNGYTYIGYQTEDDMWHLDCYNWKGHKTDSLYFGSNEIMGLLITDGQFGNVLVTTRGTSVIDLPRFEIYQKGPIMGSMFNKSTPVNNSGDMLQWIYGVSGIRAFVHGRRGLYYGDDGTAAIFIFSAATGELLKVVDTNEPNITGRFNAANGFVYSEVRKMDVTNELTSRSLLFPTSTPTPNHQASIFYDSAAGVPADDRMKAYDTGSTWTSANQHKVLTSAAMGSRATVQFASGFVQRRLTQDTNYLVVNRDGGMTKYVDTDGQSIARTEFINKNQNNALYAYWDQSGTLVQVDPNFSNSKGNMYGFGWKYTATNTPAINGSWNSESLGCVRVKTVFPNIVEYKTIHPGSTASMYNDTILGINHLDRMLLLIQDTSTVHVYNEDDVEIASWPWPVGLVGNGLNQLYFTKDGHLLCIDYMNLVCIHHMTGQVLWNLATDSIDGFESTFNVWAVYTDRTVAVLGTGQTVYMLGVPTVLPVPEVTIPGDGNIYAASTYVHVTIPEAVIDPVWPRIMVYDSDTASAPIAVYDGHVTAGIFEYSHDKLTWKPMPTAGVIPKAGTTFRAKVNVPPGAAAYIKGSVGVDQ